jgi:hypothetical protein
MAQIVLRGCESATSGLPQFFQIAIAADLAENLRPIEARMVITPIHEDWLYGNFHDPSDKAL